MARTRCGGCGKWGTDVLGEYVRHDGSAGYIRAWDDAGDGPLLCEECRDGRCPSCGGKSVVTLTPLVPGPDGWGGRCKDCGHRWSSIL